MAAPPPQTAVGERASAVARLSMAAAAGDDQADPVVAAGGRRGRPAGRVAPRRFLPRRHFGPAGFGPAPVGGAVCDARAAHPHADGPAAGAGPEPARNQRHGGAALWREPGAPGCARPAGPACRHDRSARPRLSLRAAWAPGNLRCGGRGQPPAAGPARGLTPRRRRHTGLAEEGLFRRAGSHQRIAVLRAQCEVAATTSGGLPGAITSATVSPHDVAGVLKLFLHSTPEPLLSARLVDCFAATRVRGGWWLAAAADLSPPHAAGRSCWTLPRRLSRCGCCCCCCRPPRARACGGCWASWPAWPPAARPTR
jgi:hypothetical protein